MVRLIHSWLIYRGEARLIRFRDCTIVEHPAAVDALVDHPVEDHELVLSGDLDDDDKTFRAKAFANRAIANEQLKSGDSH